MAEFILMQSVTERQCFSVAYDLIKTVIDIKSTYLDGEGYPELLQDKIVVKLIKRLEKWTDLLISRDGGL